MSITSKAVALSVANQAADALEKYVDNDSDRLVVAELRACELYVREPGNQLEQAYVASMDTLRHVAQTIIEGGGNVEDIGTPLGDVFWMQATIATKLRAQMTERRGPAA